MTHDEYAVEPIRGLPERPPEGERVVWQGAPSWRALALRAFHARKVAIYFILLWVVFAVFDLVAGDYGRIAVIGMRLAIPAVLGVCVLSFLAWLYARMTVYTITTQRLVIRSGIALPMTVNVPFAQIESAGRLDHGDGTSDIPVRVARGQNSSYVILWPNVRPRHFRRPEPMLRGLSDGDTAAGVLASALGDFHDTEDDSVIPRVGQAAAEHPARAEGFSASNQRRFA